MAGKDIGSTGQLPDSRRILNATISQIVIEGKTSLISFGSN